MKKNILNKAILLLAVLVIFGCKVRKPAPSVSTIPQQTSNANANAGKAEIVKRVNDKQVNFNTLLIKAKAELNINNNKNDVSMNIRMQKGKAIWISVSVPIIGEVARAFITPDSIKILNKLENSYTKKSFDYVYQFTSKKVSFNTLQNTFIGNAPEETVSTSAVFDNQGGKLYLKGSLAELAFSLILNENYNLIQSNLTDRAASQSLAVTYSDYRHIGDEEMPHTVLINSEALNKTVIIDLRYTNITINEAVDFPFSVPKRYTVKD